MGTRVTHATNPSQTRAEWLTVTSRQLADAGRPTPALDARLILQHILSIDVSELRANSDAALPEWALGRLDAMTARAQRGEPIAYLIGRQHFLDFDLEVGPGVLIPRPESEEVLAHLLKPDGRVLRVLDIGAGSGALLIGLLRAFPQAIGVGVDISAIALSYAARNCKRLGLGERADLVQGDVHTLALGQFDRIICNPPYIAASAIADLAPGVRDFEPRLALDGGADGLDFYRAFAPRLGAMLRSGGIAAFEIGYDQGVTVPALLAAVLPDYTLSLHHDLAGQPRAVVVRPTQAT
jgi:release factor glutamine methyltransferase